MGSEQERGVSLSWDYMRESNNQGAHRGLLGRQIPPTLLRLQYEFIQDDIASYFDGAFMIERFECIPQGHLALKSNPVTVN